MSLYFPASSRLSLLTLIMSGFVEISETIYYPIDNRSRQCLASCYNIITEDTIRIVTMRRQQVSINGIVQSFVPIVIIVESPIEHRSNGRIDPKLIGSALPSCRGSEDEKRATRVLPICAKFTSRGYK